ncbi:MAG: shikimate kinase [Brevibacterium yomogidense]|uniref:shikimate kinase n=1 Tax=Brevibacterium sp. Mu109 TaxID=1255669 RepID=UPI000C684525|nr:shikimate kinase [Brevibacterium sp. Mu109]SMX67887.1 shikimate kinase [Brevibacterium sp. Mu109]
MVPEEAPLPRPAPPLDPAPASGARIVLIGPPAAGKSTIGRLLGARLGLPLYDTDAQIVAAHGAIPEIFAARGEPRFREIEREVVRRTLRRLLGEPAVVSLGGGAILNSGTRAQLRHPALKVIGIEIDDETAALRLGGSSRPLLAGDEDPVARWRAIVDERRSLYDEIATAQVAASHGPPSTVVNRIVDVLTGLQRAEEYARYQDTPPHEGTEPGPDGAHRRTDA